MVLMMANYFRGLKMLDLKNAYVVLGLKENASRDEVEKKFEQLIRRNRSAKMAKDQNHSSDTTDLDEIREAYNTIISNEHAVQEKDEEKRNPKKPNPIFKMLGIDEKKARNYIYYHKFYYIFGIIGLILLISLIKTTVFHVNPDVNIAFVGQIYYKDTIILAKKIKANDPSIKEISIDGVILTGDSKNMQESAMQQKAMVLFAAGDIDVFILDKANFDRYAPQGVFMSLDDLVLKLGLDRNDYKDYILKARDEKAAHLYGIDIKNSKLLKDSEIAGDNLIVTIRVNAKHYDKAVKILELFAK